jgi:hypothetical protein
VGLFFAILYLGSTFPGFAKPLDAPGWHRIYQCPSDAQIVQQDARLQEIVLGPFVLASLECLLTLGIDRLRIGQGLKLGGLGKSFVARMSHFERHFALELEQFGRRIGRGRKRRGRQRERE